MATLLLEDSDFTILRGFDYIVVRKDSPYSFHSHFRRYSGALSLIRLFGRKLQPENEYFYVAMQRITTPEEFEKFAPQKKQKQKYYNANKGLRR